jgi:hypothetical protein
VANRRQRPPWDRRRPYPRHPLGRARRRWPRAFDGGHDPRPALRYRSGLPREGGATTIRRRALQRLRETPVRSGLIGLAIAGTAAPIGVNRYQQALRADPAHERVAEAEAARHVGGAHEVDAQQLVEDLHLPGVLVGRETLLAVSDELVGRGQALSCRRIVQSIPSAGAGQFVMAGCQASVCASRK